MENLILHQLEEFSMNGLKLIGQSEKILKKLVNPGSCVDTSETQMFLGNIPFRTHFVDQEQLPPVMDTPAYERSSEPCLLKCMAIGHIKLLTLIMYWINILDRTMKVDIPSPFYVCYK